MSDTCETDECVIAVSIVGILVIVIMAWFGWTYAIRVSDGTRNRMVSLVLAVFAPPIFAIIYAFQFPLRVGGTNANTQPLFTAVMAVVAFCFWPFVIFLPLLNGDDGSDSSPVVMNAKISANYENGEWV